MRLTNKFQSKVASAIREDSGLDFNTSDWWTSFTDGDYCYDVNVFDNEFCDCADDEFGVTVYNVIKDENGDLHTDFEGECGEQFQTFYVKKSHVASLRRYRVGFNYTVTGVTSVCAFTEQDAKNTIREELEEDGLEGLYELNVTHREVMATDAEEII